MLPLPQWISTGGDRRKPANFSGQLAAFLLVTLFLVQALSLFGYAFFVRQPENLSARPWAVPIFTVSFPVFAQLQIGIAFLAMVTFLISRVGVRWLPAFLCCALLSLGSELAGTTYGVPFGEYSYNTMLGVKLFDRVPLLIPLSWFFMSLASYGIVAHRIAVTGFSFRRVLLASWLLVTWDLTLDPAMSHLTPFWIWNHDGALAYYGMPLLNIAGWALTGAAIMVAYEMVRAVRWVVAVPRSYFVVFYLLNLFLPLGIVAVAGLWEAFAITVASLLACLVSTALLRRLGADRSGAYLSSRPLGRV